MDSTDRRYVHTTVDDLNVNWINPRKEYNMDNPILRRLFESRQTIDPNLLDAEDGSDEAYDLMDVIEMKLRSVRDKLFDDVEIDDSGMNSYGDVAGERTIVYQCELYHSKSDGKSAPKMIPLNVKEKKSLYNSLMDAIQLPESDDKYEYEVSISYVGTTLKITLKREDYFD